MGKEETRSDQREDSEHAPYRVRLPGFITDKEVGLGDAIKRVTYALGIKPCAGCEHRAAVLNRWMVLTGPRAK